MKKTLFALALLSTSALAQEITVISPSSKSSPTSVFAMGIKEAVNGTFYQSSTCEDAIAKYNKTSNAVFVYNSSMEFGARNTGLNCPLKGNATVDNTVYVGRTYMYICRQPGTNHQFGKEANTLGMASMYATKSHEKTFNEAGANVKIVPYAGSKDVVNAVRAGDITLGWIGSGMAKQQVEQGNLDCVYSTDPADANYLGRALPKLAVPNFNIGYVVYTNTKDSEVMQKLRSVRNNEQFNTYLNTSLTSGTWSPTQSDLDAMMKKVGTMEKYWIDKK